MMWTLYNKSLLIILQLVFTDDVMDDKLQRKMRDMLNKGIIENRFWVYYLILLFTMCVQGLELPENCKSDQFYDTGSLMCRSCPANASMVTSLDGEYV